MLHQFSIFNWKIFLPTANCLILQKLFQRNKKIKCVQKLFFSHYYLVAQIINYFNTVTMVLYRDRGNTDREYIFSPFFSYDSFIYATWFLSISKFLTNFVCIIYYLIRYRYRTYRNIYFFFLTSWLWIFIYVPYHMFVPVDEYEKRYNLSLH